MRAILDLRFKDNYMVYAMDYASDENIYHFVDACERAYGEIVSKNVEFLLSEDDSLTEYLKRQKVFYKLAKIASVTMKGNIDDVLFYDKIRIFLSLPQDKYIWTITPYSTHLYLVLDGKISDDIASYIRLDLKYGFEAFKIDIKYGSVLPLTMEELEKGTFVYGIVK